MAAITDYYSEENLARIKTNISTSYMYFEDNYKTFRDFKRFVFCESVTEDQRSMLRRLNRPATEFNILEAYISRLLGEFSKHEPSITVSPAEDAPIPVETTKFIENHIRHTMYEADKNSFAYEIYKDLLAGGFSVAKVYTDYSSPMSFDQTIKWEKEFDPTLCGFDPLARASHKGDGEYSFALRPMLKDDFERRFPDLTIENMEYMRDIEGFSWTYIDSQDRKTILVGDYYEKKKRKVKIVKLANGVVMSMKKYKKMKALWEQEQFIEQIPVIIGSPRITELETICHYKLIGSKILEYTETDYSFLPHVFFDGNSIQLTRGSSSTNSYQMTRPYVYHAKGIQELKNFAGQTLANHLQTLVQHKWIIKKEALPPEKDYLAALTNPQRANTMVVQAFMENDPTIAIPDPIVPVQQMPAPPEVMAAFSASDPTTQVILGSYASNLGQNDNDLSGKAVIESTSVGNSASMPYVVGYLAGLNQMALIQVDLMPKYILGKRKLPTADKAGEKNYQEVNTPGNPQLDYGNHALNVCIEAGVNFAVQKNQALQQITSLMQASQDFAAFMNDDSTLPILVDNLTCYGSDRLKEAVPQWIQKKAKMQQQAQQQQQEAMQNDPSLLRAKTEMAKVQQQAEQDQVENQFKAAQLSIDKELADAKLMEAEAKISESQVDQAIRLEEGETSRFNHSIDAATKIAELEYKEHQKHIDLHGASMAERELQHSIEQSKKGDTNGN